MLSNKNIDLKKAILLLVIVEVFWFIAGTIIHEWTHATLFYLETGRWGVPHFLDKLAFSYGTIAVTVPPVSQKVSTVFSTEMHEYIAYAVQSFCTVLFAILLLKNIQEQNRDLIKKVKKFVKQGRN